MCNDNLRNILEQIFENFNSQNYFTTFCDITTCNMQYTQYIKLIDILGTHIINIVETFFLSNSSNADS